MPVDVLVVGSKFCPVGSSAVLALREIVPEFEDEVKLREVPPDTSAVERYGVVDGIFINGKAPFFGPVKEEAVRQAIRDELRLAKSNSST